MLSWLGLGCDGASGTAEPGVALRVAWLGRAPSADLPADVDAIQLYVLRAGEPFDMADFAITSVARLPDADDDGHPELVVPQLPTYEEVSLLVYGLDASSNPLYIGHAGPMVLRAGERRYVDLRMFQVGMSTEVTGLSGRIGATATALPDGRVLVAGGFSDARPMTCPSDTAPESRCFDLHATRDAFVFDPATGVFHPVRGGGLLEARGGHTATALSDGRVVVAGGAAQAMLVMSPQGLPAVTGFAPGLRATMPTMAHATFEIFDPDANPELVDADRDGDQGRGGFVGSADAPGTPGRLNHGRFLHAAVAIPARPDRVMFVGGIGDPAAAGSWEIFDVHKPGGWGVYAETGNRLSAARPAPSAVALTMPAPGRVWIFGGRIATSDAELADVWSESATDPNGTSQAASAMTTFPRSSMGDAATYPQYSLVGAQVAAVGGGGSALVVGWLGPRCMPGMTTIGYPADDTGAGTELCSHAADPGKRRSFAVANATGVATPFNVMQPHAFGTSVTLDDGSVAVVGGVSSIIFTPQPAIDVFTGALDAMGAPVPSTARVSLRGGRLLHATAPLRDRGMLTIGGARFSTDARTITLVDTAEALYLQ